MITVNTEINNIKVSLTAVEKGTRIVSAKRELGLKLGDNYSVSKIDGDDYDDWSDFVYAFPQTAAELINAGLDTENVIAIIEIRK